LQGGERASGTGSSCSFSLDDLVILLSIPIDSREALKKGDSFINIQQRRSTRSSGINARDVPLDASSGCHLSGPPQRFALLIPSVNLASSFLMNCQLHAGKKGWPKRVAKPRSKVGQESNPSSTHHQDTSRTRTDSAAASVPVGVLFWLSQFSLANRCSNSMRANASIRWTCRGDSVDRSWSKSQTEPGLQHLKVIGQGWPGR